MIDVQDIFNIFYPEYKKLHNTCSSQDKAAVDIMNCRTAAMGGHISKCSNCGYTHISYNSCRNRHCPLCQSIPKEKWIDARKEELLNAPYFHIVFTVPDEIKMLIFQNQKLLYSLMYKAVSDTLAELSASKKYLGAQIGFISVLHTWGQGLVFHPHIHNIVLAGGLTEDRKWRCSSKKFFIPVKVLSKKFRGKFLYHLKKYYNENKLEFYGELKEFENPEAFQSLLNNCYKKSWYIYSKRPFSSPSAVIEYLGRYTHRVAISNNRIAGIDKKSVTIKYKDYRESGKEKLMTISGVEFIRRFLMHILPKGFVKLRHYGILGNRNKKTKLELCRKLTKSIKLTSRFKNLSTLEIFKIITGKDITKCPECNEGNMKLKFGWNKGVLSSP
jgi:hypothetical protein